MKTLSVSEIRDRLTKYGFSTDEVNSIKGKTNLMNTLNQAMGNDSVTLDDDETIEDLDMEDLDEEKTSNSDINDGTPSMESPEWHDYVMSLFTEDELVKTENGDKLPKLAGLRRITKTIFRIMINSTKIVGLPSVNNNFMAVAESFIVVELPTREVVEYTDVADCTQLNTDPPFNAHLTSTAASKAEARNLRKILCLRSIAAEEHSSALHKKDETPARVEDDESFTGPSEITDTQIALIDKVCKELNIDVMKFINQKDKQYTNIKEVGGDTAISMCRTLHLYRNKEDGYQQVPDELVGYQQNWNEELK